MQFCSYEYIWNDLRRCCDDWVSPFIICHKLNQCQPPLVPFPLPAVLEVLALNALRALFPPLGAERTDGAPPARPGSGKRRMCALAVMWVEPHPDALAAAGWCPPSSWWCCAQNLQRRTDAVWRHKRAALRGDKKQTIQTNKHGYLTGVQFFFYICLFFTLWCCVCPVGVNSTCSMSLISL